jgi:hypothetical protein
MVSNTRIAAFVSLTFFCVSVSTPSARAENFTLEDERATFGKKNGLRFELGPLLEGGVDGEGESTTPEFAGLFGALKVALFGKDRSILEAKSGMTNLLEGESDFFWGGFKVWSSKPAFKDGAFSVSAGLPTVSMRSPIVGVPVGPVVLQVDAGIAAEAEIEARVVPLLSLPIEFTSVRAELAPRVNASGFVEGYAKWLIIRAGVGGEVEFVRADTKMSGQVGFNGLAPTFSLGQGFVSTLAGKIYGFVDYLGIFSWKWKRALKPVIADWKGKCYSFGPANELIQNRGDACASVR